MIDVKRSWLVHEVSDENILQTITVHVTNR